MMYSKQWSRYLDLMAQRPEAFRDTGTIHIVTDPAIVTEYEKRTGTVIGVRYESGFNILVVDLVWEKEGQYYPYERLLPAVDRGAVVCVPAYGDKYLLLRQYRHALRDYQYAFPRGFAEAGLSGEENARKELMEELGAVTGNLRFLGTVVADSGMSGSVVEIWHSEVVSYDAQTGHEGIVDTVAVSRQELGRMLRDNEISDCFTLSACAYLAWEKEA